jgi:hypothetical protein
MKKLLNFSEYYNDQITSLDLGDYADQLNDYRASNTYICDAISEIADRNTSIYYSDIITFLTNHVDAVQRAIDEFGWDGVGADLYKASQMAEFLAIEQDLYNHITDGVKLTLLDYLKYDLKAEYISEELADLLDEWSEQADTGDRFSDFTDLIDDHISEQENNNDEDE